MTEYQVPKRDHRFAAQSTIGAKLIRTIVLTSGVALVLASIALITYDYFTTRHQLVRDLMTLSQVISDNSAAPLMFEDADAAADIMAALRAQPNISEACLYDSSGLFFAEYRPDDASNAQCPETANNPGIVSANGVITLTQAVVFDNEQVGFFLVRLKLTELVSQIITFCVWVIFIAGLALASSFILSAFFQRKITRPLLNLVGLAESVTQKKDYTVRAVQESDDEIGELMAAFNEMLSTVEERDQELTVARDNAETKSAALQREVAIRRSVERQRDQAIDSLTDAIESMSEGFAVWNADDRLVMCNSNYRELFRKLSDVLVEGCHFRDFLTAAVERGLYDTEGLTLDEYIEKHTEEHRNPSGAYERLFGKDRWIQINKHRTETGGIVGTWTDVSERRRVENTVRELALHDPLTGLANRTLFHSSLTEALQEADEQGRRAALLFVDLDRFKPINDEFGHVVGDKLLVKIAERLVDATREGDTVARLGGDEFAVILRKIAQQTTASELAQRIVDSLAKPIEIEGEVVRTGASVGISVFPEHDTDVDELIRKADVALYQAKADGRGTYRVYDEGLHETLRNQNRLEDELRTAIDADQLTLFYQPQFSLHGENLIGVEALVRWRHPERGLLLPSEFMPVAESSGLVLKIDEWVLRHACEQGRQWKMAGLPDFRISVNVSARQFRSDDLVSSVGRVLRETKMEPDMLEIEITEHMVMDDVDEASRRLSRLHDLGIRLAVDDFGTGYSSLSYLKKFPVWRLKIDRSFVRDIAVDPDDAAIIDAIIRLGRSLRLKVLAEGVETGEQVAALRRLGCDEVQGFHYARPMPADKLAKWMQEQFLRRAPMRKPAAGLETVDA